jgi:hypothetical protein
MNIIIPVVPSCGVTEYLVIQVDWKGDVIKSVCASRPEMVLSTGRGEDGQYIIGVKLDGVVMLVVKHKPGGYLIQDWTVKGDVIMCKLAGYDPIRLLTGTVNHFALRLERESHIYSQANQPILESVISTLKDAVAKFVTVNRNDMAVKALLERTVNDLMYVVARMDKLCENVSQCYLPEAMQTRAGVKVCCSLAACILRECY